MFHMRERHPVENIPKSLLWTIRGAFMEIEFKPILKQQMVSRMIEGMIQKAIELKIAVSIAVVDDGGNLISFIRMDGAPLMGGTIAQNKAYTAVGFGVAFNWW
jgi:uncharacterized protein GlcG (DUF336 family)